MWTPKQAGESLEPFIVSQWAETRRFGTSKEFGGRVLIVANLAESPRSISLFVSVAKTLLPAPSQLERAIPSLLRQTASLKRTSKVQDPAGWFDWKWKRERFLSCLLEVLSSYTISRLKS